MSKSPVWYLLRIAAPIIGSMLSRTAMGFVDFVMISRLGTEAQAAITPANLVLFSVISFGMGACTLVNTFVAQALGRDEPRECSAFAWQGVYLALFIGVGVAPAWWGIAPLFAAIGHEPSVQTLEVAYAQVGLLSIAPSLMVFALSGFFTGLHRPGVPLAAALIGNVFNILANYALIYGHFGFPALGLAGAAWATTLASALNALIMLGWMLLPHYRAQYDTAGQWQFSAPRFMRLVRFGAPAGLQFASDIIAWTYFTNVYIGRFGKEQLAAHNIAIQFLHLSFMPAIGVGTALTVAVGKAIGKGDLPQVERYVRAGLWLSVGYMVLLGLLAAALRHPLIALLNRDVEVVRWGGYIILFCAVFQLFDAMQITYTHALRGAGDTTWPAVAFLLCAVFILLGGSELAVRLVPHWGSCGPWLATTVYITVAGLLFLWRYRHGAWRRIELFQPAAVLPA